MSGDAAKPMAAARLVRLVECAARAAAQVTDPHTQQAMGFMLELLVGLLRRPPLEKPVHAGSPDGTPMPHPQSYCWASTPTGDSRKTLWDVGDTPEAAQTPQAEVPVAPKSMAVRDLQPQMERPPEEVSAGGPPRPQEGAGAAIHDDEAAAPVLRPPPAAPIVVPPPQKREDARSRPAGLKTVVRLGRARRLSHEHSGGRGRSPVSKATAAPSEQPPSEVEELGRPARGDEPPQVTSEVWQRSAISMTSPELPLHRHQAEDENNRSDSSMERAAGSTEGEAHASSTARAAHGDAKAAAPGAQQAGGRWRGVDGGVATIGDLPSARALRTRSFGETRPRVRLGFGNVSEKARDNTLRDLRRLAESCNATRALSLSSAQRLRKPRLRDEEHDRSASASVALSPRQL